MKLIALQCFYSPLDNIWTYEFTLLASDDRLIDEKGTSSTLWEAMRIIINKLVDLGVKI